MTFVRLLIPHVVYIILSIKQVRCTVGVKCVSKDNQNNALGAGYCFYWSTKARIACLGPEPYYNLSFTESTFCDACARETEKCCYDSDEPLPRDFSKHSCPAQSTTTTTTTTTSTTTRPPLPPKSTTEPYIPPWVPDPYPGPAPPYDPNPAPWYPPTPPPTTPPRQFDIYWYNSPDTTSAGCDLENRWYPFGCYQYGDIHLSYWKPKPGFNFFRDKEYPGPWWKLAYWKGGKSVSHDFYLPFKPAVAQPRTLLVITSMTLVRREDIPQNEAIYAISWVRQVDGTWVLLATDGTFDTNTAPGIVEDPDQSIGTPAPPSTTPFVNRPLPWYMVPVINQNCDLQRFWYPFGCKMHGNSFPISYSHPMPGNDQLRSKVSWSGPWYQATYNRPSAGYQGTMFMPFLTWSHQEQTGIIWTKLSTATLEMVPEEWSVWVHMPDGTWNALHVSGNMDPRTSPGIQADPDQTPQPNPNG